MSDLRSVLIRSLALLGLAPVRSVGQLSARAEKAEARAVEFKSQLVDGRAEIQRGKARVEDLLKQLKSAQADAEHQRARATEVIASVEKWRGKAEKLKVKVARTAGTVQTATEHLMATETKLDLLEAAINLLDRRTRTAVDGSAAGAPGNGQAS